jgi:type 1 glutamine amidotransferase
MCNQHTIAQSLPKIELNDKWINEIKSLAPEKTHFPKSKTHKVLVFSLFTGFDHWVIPHTEAMLKTITDKVGGFEMTYSKDVKYFDKKMLQQFDAVILNNNCSIGDKRNLFWDVFKKDPNLDSAQAMKKAEKFEKYLLDYVKNGGGIMSLHGAVTMQNKSKAFSNMLGGSFDYHPKQQNIDVKLVDANHPLVQGFGGKGFSHIDEPYFFNNAYMSKNFRPLLYMENSKIEGNKYPDGDDKRYIAWIKKYGKGNIFYSSPAHNAQSFSNPQLLQFFLDGLQFVVGDVVCDANPLGN